MVETQETRIPELDGVRGVAIALVLAWHYVLPTFTAEPGSLFAYLLKALTLSWAGVDLFFVLSGYLIGGILLDHRESRHYFKTFFVRRIARIVPAYALLLVSFLVVRALAAGSGFAGFTWYFEGPIPTWAYAAYLQNFWIAASGSFGANWLSPTWSLAVEEQFYLLLPAMIRFLPPRWLPEVLFASIAASPLLRIGLLLASPHGGVAGYVLLPTRWDALFLGVLGAWMVRRPRSLRWLQANLNVVRATAVICILGLGWLLERGQGITSAGMAYFGHTLLATLGLAVIFLATRSREGHFRSSLRNPLLVWVGTISYGIYLFHLPILALVRAGFGADSGTVAPGTRGVVVLMALGLSLALAWISWSQFEQRLVQLGRSVRYD